MAELNSMFLKTPYAARKFARRRDLLIRDLLFFDGGAFAVLLVERVGPRWVVYYKAKGLANRVYFPSERKAKVVWEAAMDGEVSSLLNHDRIAMTEAEEAQEAAMGAQGPSPAGDGRRDAAVALPEPTSEIGLWFAAYLATTNPTSERVAGANRVIAALTSAGMDLASKAWWEKSIPRKFEAKAIFEQGRAVVAAITASVNNVGRTSRNYQADRIRLLSAVLLYARLMTEDKYPYKSFDRLAESIRTAFKGIRATEFKPKTNYTPLGIGDLDILLKAIARKGLGFYNFAILALSSLVRYRDLRHITKSHLGPDNRLIYNKEVHGRFLSRKTLESGKIEPSRLTNPTASLVTRVILRHLPFKPFDKRAEELFAPGNKVRESLTPEGRKNAVLRSLRTTGATMLVESVNSETCRTPTTREVSHRLSHISETMLIQIYARTRPPGISENIDQYLDLPEVIVGGNDLAQTEAAFDLWLVSHMLETYAGRKEEEALKEALAKEAGKPTGGVKGKRRTLKVG